MGTSEGPRKSNQTPPGKQLPRHFPTELQMPVAGLPHRRWKKSSPVKPNDPTEKTNKY